jgi:uncharacterized protein
MSQLNVDVIRSVYDALESQDLDGVLEHVDNDVRIFATEGLPWSGTYDGPSGVEEFIRTVEEHVRLSIETAELIDSGESVAQFGRTVGEAHATGHQFDLREIHVWTLRAGKVISFQNYVDRAGQRRALGLPNIDPPADEPRDPNREPFWS